METEQLIYNPNHMAVINCRINREASLRSNKRGSSQFTTTKRVLKSEGGRRGGWSRCLIKDKEMTKADVIFPLIHLKLFVFRSRTSSSSPMAASYRKANFTLRYEGRSLSSSLWRRPSTQGHVFCALMLDAAVNGRSWSFFSNLGSSTYNSLGSCGWTCEWKKKHGTLLDSVPYSSFVGIVFCIQTKEKNKNKTELARRRCVWLCCENVSGCFCLAVCTIVGSFKYTTEKLSHLYKSTL